MSTLSIRFRVGLFAGAAALLVLAVGLLGLGHAAVSDREILALYDRDPSEIRLAALAGAGSGSEEEREDARVRAERFQTATIALMATSVLLLLVLGGLTAAQIARPIELLARGIDARSGSEVDLATKLPATGPLELQALAAGIDRLNATVAAVIRQVQRAWIEVLGAVTGIAAAASELDGTIERHRSATREALTWANRISSASAALTGTMSEVAASSQHAAVTAGAGRESLGQMQAAMGTMVNASSSLSEKLDQIHAKAGNIRKVVETIHKVAEETNLLSLNAGIEAEKAGEYGFGFAVVAREIRRLADQTAGSTLDIDQIVLEMRSAITAGVLSVETFGREVETGVQASERVGGQLAEVIEQVQALSPRFDAAHTSALAQSESAQQIDEAMRTVSDTSEATLRSLAETNRSLITLRGVVNELQAQVARFKVG